MYIDNRGVVRFGNNLTINSAYWANPIGGNMLTFLQIRGVVLIIGNNVGISYCAITCSKSIWIGDNVLIGSGCKIYDTDFHPIDSRYGDTMDNSRSGSEKIVLEDGCFVGAHSIILKGVTIGKNAVIGAGSVVAKDVPAGEIWAGNPVKYIRTISD